jgi:hypothetical protein
MPEYDAVNYPKPLPPNLTGGEIGRQPDTLPGTWPTAPQIPEPYTGPVPSREFETSNRRILTAAPVPPVPPPTEPATQAPIDAPPA